MLLCMCADFLLLGIIHKLRNTIREEGGFIALRAHTGVLHGKPSGHAEHGEHMTFSAPRMWRLESRARLH